MFCVHCGKEIKESSKFCPFCGNRILLNEEVTTEDVTKTVVLNNISNINEDIPQNQSMNSKNGQEVQPDLETPQDSKEIQVETEYPQENQEVQVESENPQENQEIQVESVFPQENQEKQPQSEYPQYIQGIQPQFDYPQHSLEIQPQTEFPQYNPQVQPQPVYPPNNQEVQPKTKKKKSTKILIIVLVVIILAAGGGVGGYFIYQNFLDKQAVKVISLFDDDNYEESTSIYKKYCSDKEELRKEVEDQLLERIQENKNAYQDGSKTYQEVIDFFSIIEQYDNSILNEVVEDANDWVNMIQKSRDDYDIAHSALESADYETAIKYYMLVIQEDTTYYNKAQEELVTAQENLERQLEEQAEKERLEALKQDAILAASDYANYSDYDSAIYEIEWALYSLPEDSELSELLYKYQSLKAEAEERVDEDLITFETYEDTYYEGDLVIATTYFQLPKIMGDTPAYQLINSDMEQRKEYLIDWSDQMAEDSRSYSMEDYFYPSSMNISCSVGYNGGGIIAFTFSGYDYYGGAHGIPYYETYMYNLSTGQRISLTDILAISNDDFKQIVVTEFEKLINLGKDDYYPEAMETVKACEVSSYGYYLVHDGLHIYFDPYALSDYAMGFVQVFIPYEGVVNFINN